jgi:hypothetical protein
VIIIVRSGIRRKVHGMGAVDQATTGGHLERYDEALARDPMSAFGLVREWMRTDWRSLFAELRERRPVFVTPAFTVVTRFADVTEVLSTSRSSRYVPSVRASTPRWAPRSCWAGTPRR